MGYNIPPYRDIDKIDFTTAAGANRVPNQSSVTAFGYITNCGGAVANIQCWQPQVAWALPASPVAVEVLSTSASDGVGGTGARKVFLIGVGIGFVYQNEIIVMNGTSTVASTLTWMAINTLVVFDDPVVGFGSAKANVGDITARITGAGATQAFIAAGNAISHGGKYTVPAGYTWLVNNFFIAGNKPGSPASSFSFNALIIPASGLLIHGLPQTVQNGSVVQIALPKTPLPILEKNTFAFQVQSVSIAGLDISIGATGLLSIN